MNFLQSNKAKAAVLVALLLLVAAFPASATTWSGFSFLDTIKEWISGPVGVTVASLLIAFAFITLAATKGQGISGLMWTLLAISGFLGAGGLVTAFWPNASTSGFLF